MTCFFLCFHRAGLFVPSHQLMKASVAGRWRGDTGDEDRKVNCVRQVTSPERNQVVRLFFSR